MAQSFKQGKGVKLGMRDKKLQTPISLHFGVVKVVSRLIKSVV